MSQELTVPDWLKPMMAEDTNATSLIASVSSVPRISLNGNRFRFIKDGEEVYKENDELFSIILGAQPEAGLAKTYYSKGYQPGNTDPPDCSSSDGIQPDTWVTNKQCDLCSRCQWNQWGSAKSMSGGKAKACRESKRLYIIDAKKGLESTAYLLNVTISSLKNLTAYGKQLIKLGVPMSAVITRLTFDEDASVPVLEFEMKGFLNEKMGPKAIERADQKEWEEFDTKQLSHDGATAGSLPPPTQTQQAPAQQTQPVEQAPVQTQPVQQQQPAKTEPESVEDLLQQW